MYFILSFSIFCCVFVFACSTANNDSNDEDSLDSDDDDSQDDDDAKMAFDYRSSYDMPEDVWTDTESGLMWQVWPKLFKLESAIEYCNTVDYYGHSDWRLPTISELRTLVRGCPGTYIDGGCGITDSCVDTSYCWSDECHGCKAFEGPAEGGIYWPSEMKGIKGIEDSTTWSITEHPYGYYCPNCTWTTIFYNGSMGSASDYHKLLVRCVR